MFSLRTHAIISASLFGAMLLFAFIGNALISYGVIKNFGPLQLPMQILFFSIFIAFGFSMIPVMVKTVIHFQVRSRQRQCARHLHDGSQ